MMASPHKPGPLFVKLRLALFCALCIAATVFVLQWLLPFLRPQRVWAARDVPVAFWAWRTEAPTDAEVASVALQTKAQTLFLHAGQIHDESGTLKRVRPIAGSFPRGIELHLVYNSTPTVLTEFERLDQLKLAHVIAETYAQDRAQAVRDEARVVGLQLDIDAPTRLLPQYGQLLRAVRERLPAGTRLSVTGLPTWMESASLKDVLASVDFWIPQCYGAQIPQRLEQEIAISSPRAVERAVRRARELDKPFYAGLAAYGYTLLYDARGALIALRGDMNPAHIATDANLQLIERKPFEPRAESDKAAQTEIKSEWHYVYRVRTDGLIDGLIVRAGDRLVLDVPSASVLRESARVVREVAGEKLLGLCIFRLPNDDDPSTLPLKQTAAALFDAPLTSAIDIQAKPPDASTDKEQAALNSVLLIITNSGNTSAVLGADGLVLDVRVPAGSVRAVRPDGFSAVEALCESGEQRAGGNQASLQPCAERRANVIRFRSANWTAGARALARISFTTTMPRQLSARVRMQTDDGLAWQQESEITIGDQR